MTVRIEGKPAIVTTSRRRLARGIVICASVAILVGGAGLALHHFGALRGLRQRFRPAGATGVVPGSGAMPSILSTSPGDCSTGADPGATIVIKIGLPKAPLDEHTVNDDSVGLFQVENRTRVPAKVTVEGDTLRVTPLAKLRPNANYRVHVLPGLADQAGNPIRQLTSSFFTSVQPPAGVAFEKVDLPAAKGEGFTCIEFGPDGKLYAATHDGKLIRYSVNPDGTLGSPETFRTLVEAEHGPRLFTGFTFDPRSTAAAPVIYLTHSEFGFEGVADFTGKISRMSGPNFERFETLVVNLPRSARDHATNQPKFGPDRALYIPQPSNTSTGAPDTYWAMRQEHGLSATILRLDVDAVTPGQTIDARTVDAGGTFVWNGDTTPLTVYATGLRMPYDLLWHSNGNLYSAINGASARGATPASSGAGSGNVAAIPNVSLAEHDWFFKIEKGRYYGHPNAVQGHFVLNGGNPTASPDFDEVSDYPVGTRPDPMWTSALYDFGMHVSPDGMVEYKGGPFRGALDGKIFVCRYNTGSDLLCLGLDAGGEVDWAVSGIPGTGNLVGPLDVTEDVRIGNLYVIEYHERQPAETRITLLRAVDPRPSGGAAVTR